MSKSISREEWMAEMERVEALEQSAKRATYRFWPPADVAILVYYYPRGSSVKALADRLGRSITAIQLKAERLGLRRGEPQDDLLAAYGFRAPSP